MVHGLSDAVRNRLDTKTTVVILEETNTFAFFMLNKHTNQRANDARMRRDASDGNDGAETASRGGHTTKTGEDGDTRMRGETEERCSSRSAALALTNARESQRPVPPAHRAQRLVRFATTMPNTITHKLMLDRGWREVPATESSWDLLYADVGWIHEHVAAKAGARMAEHQRVNHFANHAELTRKDLMAKNLNRAKRQAMKSGGADAARAFDILPQTFVMPQEALMMKRAFKDSGGLWIMKPIGRAQGKGIFVVSKVSQINKWLAEREKTQSENICVDNYVAQRYISAPYCVGGRKFDVRLYVLVLSFRPMRAYLYREGFARFTAAKYTNDRESLNDRMVHLTNHSIQKQDEAYDASVCDLRWSARSLRQYIAAKHGTNASDELIRDITKLIVNSLRSVAPIMINDRHCFELYGYDVMLDEDLRPWLIEVNASPSMSVDSVNDRELKTALFNDVLNVVDMERQYHRAKDEKATPRRVGGFDLIYDGDAIEENMTTLGASNADRVRSLDNARVSEETNQM